MADSFQVFLVLTLLRRVRQWDEFAQAEFAAFQDQLRELGLFAVFGNEAICAVETVSFDETDATGRIEFWLKNRSDWMFLSLEVRSESVFVLHETRPGSGP